MASGAIWHEGFHPVMDSFKIDPLGMGYRLSQFPELLQSGMKTPGHVEGSGTVSRQNTQNFPIGIQIIGGFGLQ
jgi:hypothetical protein